MSHLQDLVRKFHEVTNQPTSPAPVEFRKADMRATVHAEEAIESVIALVGAARAQTIVIGQLAEVLQKVSRDKKTAPSIVDAVHECCDMIIVALGTLEYLGLTSAEVGLVFDEVMRANIAKAGGPVREDGKQLKPEGWRPADTAGVLRQVVEFRDARTVVELPALQKRAAVCLIQRGDRYLCVWNSRYGGWSFPGGRVEDGEGPGGAAARELFEETGMRALGELEQVFEGPHGIVVDSTRGSIVTVFRVREYIGEPTEAEVGRPVTWLTLDEFMKWSPFAPFYERVFATIGR